MTPIIETAIGTLDGVNRIFRVSTDYQPGTPRVWRNGLLQKKADADGWIELGGKRLQLHEAPREGDIVRVYYVSIS